MVRRFTVLMNGSRFGLSRVNWFLRNFESRFSGNPPFSEQDISHSNQLLHFWRSEWPLVISPLLCMTAFLSSLRGCCWKVCVRVEGPIIPANSIVLTADDSTTRRYYVCSPFVGQAKARSISVIEWKSLCHFSLENEAIDFETVSSI